MPVRAQPEAPAQSSVWWMVADGAGGRPFSCQHYVRKLRPDRAVLPSTSTSAGFGGIDDRYGLEKVGVSIGKGMHPRVLLRGGAARLHLGHRLHLGRDALRPTTFLGRIPPGHSRFGRPGATSGLGFSARPFAAAKQTRRDVTRSNNPPQLARLRVRPLPGSSQEFIIIGFCAALQD